jgi:hypothetical protein
MEYNKIIAVTGLTGLFELIASKADGAILKSLTDKTSKFISSRVHQFTQLNTIEIYTTGENVNMVDIFSAMQKSKAALPDVKNNEAVKSYFEKVYPAMDFERVYTSDMKKIVKWFDQLTANNIEMKLDEVEEETPTAEPVLEEVVEKVEEAPKKATRKKKAE